MAKKTILIYTDPHDYWIDYSSSWADSFSGLEFLLCTSADAKADARVFIEAVEKSDVIIIDGGSIGGLRRVIRDVIEDNKGKLFIISGALPDKWYREILDDLDPSCTNVIYLGMQEIQDRLPCWEAGSDNNVRSPLLQKGVENE
jgi:hypothetical protein